MLDVVKESTWAGADCDLAEGGEAHRVQVFVIIQVNEKLSGAGVRPTRRKDNGPGLVRLLDRVILNVGGRPAVVFLDFAVGVDAELDHEVGDYAEDSSVFKEAGLNELEEAVSTFWGPVLVDLNRDFAGGATLEGLPNHDKRGARLAIGRMLSVI